jgi:predicted outer membrane repeat protein
MQGASLNSSAHLSLSFCLSGSHFAHTGGLGGKYYILIIEFQLSVHTGSQQIKGVVRRGNGEFNSSTVYNGGAVYGKQATSLQGRYIADRERTIASFLQRMGLMLLAKGQRALS